MPCGNAVGFFCILTAICVYDAFLLLLVLGIVAVAGYAQLRVSGNGRFPCCGMANRFSGWGSTAWELFHRLNRDDAGYYLKHRAEQGFTVIQAVILAELDGLHTTQCEWRSAFDK